MAVGGSAGHDGLWGVDVDEGHFTPGVDRLWEVSVLAPDEVKATQRDQRSADREAKQAATLENDRREIVQAAVKLNGPETKSGLRERVACGYRRFNAAFASLLDDGTLQTVSAVRKSNGQNYTGYALTPENNG